MDAETGIIKVNEEYGTSAIGRTPVVRVDAFLADNDGADHLVATSYIKLQIVRKASSQTPLGDQPVNLADAKELIYQNIPAAGKQVSDMGWERINKELYAHAGLTSTTFWNYFGGSSNTYEVEVKVMQKNDTWKTIKQENLSANSVQTLQAEGVKTEINLNSTTTTTAYVKLMVDNNVKTQNTYKDVDGKGAHYQVTIKIKADNNYSYKNYVLTQDFYVKDVCHKFEYNPLYHYDTYEVNGRQYDDCVVVKGQLNASNIWVMSSKVAEHFKAINGKNIFQYYNEVANVKAIKFAWKTGETGVTPAGDQTSAFEVALSHAMTTDKDIHNMTYTTTLVNNETCNYNYNIVFVNPFKAGNAKGISIFSNGAGERTGETKPEVIVVDVEGDKIYSWNAETGKLELSEKAKSSKDGYSLADESIESVTYDFDKTEEAYKKLTSNMTSTAKLEVNANGQVTWFNGGTNLKDTYELHVIATVTFKDLSVVKCRIPVTLTPTK